MNQPVAVIPVAGVGTRLRPHTHTVPKALVNVAGRAMVGHILDELIGLGVNEFVLVVGYMGDRVREYIARDYPDIQVHFVEQPDRQGLGHAIYLTREAVGDRDMLIVLGDTIFRVDFEPVLARRVSQIGVKEVEDPRRFGVVEMDGQQVRRFVEKPKDPPSNLAIVGIYYLTDSGKLFHVLEQMIAEDRRSQGEFQLTDALQTMLQEGVPMEVFNVAGWYDAGKPETLLETNRDLLDLEAAPVVREGSLVIPPVFIAPDARIVGSVIGPHATIAAGATIDGSIVRNSIVSEGASVRRMILDGSLVGDHASVSGAFQKLNVGRDSEIELS